MIEPGPWDNTEWCKSWSLWQQKRKRQGKRICVGCRMLITVTWDAGVWYSNRYTKSIFMSCNPEFGSFTQCTSKQSWIWWGKESQNRGCVWINMLLLRFPRHLVGEYGLAFKPLAKIALSMKCNKTATLLTLCAPSVILHISRLSWRRDKHTHTHKCICPVRCLDHKRFHIHAHHATPSRHI